MKRGFWTCCTMVLIIVLVFSPLTVLASNADPVEEKYLNIATFDSRPLALDRLVYMALKDTGYQMSLVNTTVQTGFEMTNSGETDGVVSYFPNLEKVYPNLRKVHVALEQTNIFAFVRSGSGVEINDWSDLSGLKVGALPQRPYISSRIPDSATVVMSETGKTLLDELASGETDVAVLMQRANEEITLPDGVVYAAQLDSLSEYLYLNKEHENLIRNIEQALNYMFADGQGEKILSSMPVPELNSRKTVLHIISSNMEMPREAQFNETLRKQFENDMSLEWYSVAFNSKRFLRDPNRLTYFANLLRQDCISRNVAAIVVSGNDALTFIGNYYDLFFRNVPVLFYGVCNLNESDFNEYAKYFTGIAEELAAYETVEAALGLFPDTKNLYVVNDYTVEGSNYRAVIENQLEPFSDRLNIEYNRNMSADSLLEHIKGLPQDTLVLVGSYFCDANGQYYPVNEMKRLLNRDCEVPIFSLYSTALEYNAIGGKGPDYEKYGSSIAERLEGVLNGGPVGDMLVVVDSTDYSRWVFDKNIMDRFGVSEKSLPAGSQVLNKIPSIWESDPRFAVTLVVLVIVSIIVVIGISVFVIRYRKLKELRISEAKIKEVKERLERIINIAPVAFMLTIDGIVVDANEYIKKNIGVKMGDRVREFYVNPGQRDSILEQVASKEVIEDQIVKFHMPDGDQHRFLSNFSSVEYDGQVANILWGMDIEESETQKDQLSEAQQSLQNIMDTLPLPVSIVDDKNLEVVYGNNAYLKMFKFDSMDKLYGCKCINCLSPIQNDGSDPEERIEFLVKSPDPVAVEVQMLTSEDEVVDVRIYTMPIVYKGTRSIIAVLTNLEQEKEYQRMHENLQKVLDLMPVPVRISDCENGRVLYANNICLKLFGYGMSDDIVGRSVIDLMAPVQSDGMASYEKMRILLNPDESASMDVTYLASSGENVETFVNTCKILYDGKKSSIAAMVDLSAERERQRMLQSAAEKEKEANLLKSRFLVNMSHEIRTPMNAIIGLTEIELHKNPSRETKEIYNKINLSAKNLLEIINDILDLSKIEADKVELFDDEFELEDVLNSALLVASPRLDGKDVEFLLNASLDLPRYITGDRTRLWQVLKNFLDNSAKYTEHGKIVLSAFVNGKRSDEQTVTITFIIEDTGIGIDEEQMQKLFMPYEQIRNDAQKRYSGTGLGMAISKQLCEIMGGELQVQSNPGEGTTVIINIPFKRAQNSETELQAVKAPVLAGTNILAVDDDSLSLDIMERLLEGNEVHCTTANNGMEAMQIILEHRDRGESFDIILLDYMMDGLNGLETARQIHMALSKAPKLLMVTAYQKLLLKPDLEENGIDDIIEKPFIPSQFVHRLCSTLGYDDGFEEEQREVFTKFENVHVLLCEDYRLNQEVATGMFAQFGVTATIAENGREGIDTLNTGEEFDLIFMDLKMPVMDGYEATEIIRADPRFDNIPIISLTADAMREVVDKCLEIGMNDHIAKPIEFSSLNNIFMKWIPESKRARGDTIPKPEVDPLNAGLSRFGGNKDLYEKALLEFSQLLPDEWPDINSYVQDMEQAQHHVHKIKGAAGNLSEKNLYHCSSSFERSLYNGKPDKQLYERLIEASGDFKKRIAGQIKDVEGILAETGTVGEFKENLNNLREALEDYDLDKCSKAVDAIKAKSWPEADEDKLRQLYELMRNYDYVGALDALESMKEMQHE